jgi:hypothetical protein
MSRLCLQVPLLTQSRYQPLRHRVAALLRDYFSVTALMSASTPIPRISGNDT